MSNLGRQNKVSYWKLHAKPNGVYYFTRTDLDDLSRPEELQLNMTKEQVRLFYHVDCGLSENEIDQRLQAAHEAEARRTGQ
jgi:hypothetical protein